jgi:hypothetical protein
VSTAQLDQNSKARCLGLAQSALLWSGLVSECHCVEAKEKKARREKRVAGKRVNEFLCRMQPDHRFRFA